jgi:hypothetical protein
MALAIAVVPALTISFTILGAPAAIYMVLRHWKRPDSLVRRYRWRRWVALTLGACEIVFWVFVIGLAITRRVGR